MRSRQPREAAAGGKAEAAGITVRVTDERGTSSTCPSCSRRVPKPAGRVFRCPHCGYGGHRDLVAAANIAARGGGPSPLPTKQGSRTAARAGTCQAPACRDVTPDAGPHHGQHPRGPWPAPARPAHRQVTGSRSPNPRGVRKNVTPDEFTSRCAKHAMLYCAIVIGGLALLVLGALRRGKDAVAQRRCHRSPACLIQARTGGPSRSGRPPPPTTRGTNRMDLKPTEFG
jgi:hypothetical protein